MAMGSAGLVFHVLGPLTAFRDATRLDPGPARQRAVLALLLISANEVVSVDRIVDQLWSDPPPAAVSTLHTYISHLRRILEPARASRAAPTVLVSEAPGYRLRVDRDALDAFVFDDRLTVARGAAERQEWAAALESVDAALGLWSGVPLADFEHEDFTQSWRARLEERKAAAEELRIDALVHLGRNLDAVADLEELVTRWPLRERFRTQQVLALARANRQADALRAYDRARSYLLDELGIDPGPDLEVAYRRVLAQDEALFATTPHRTAPAPRVPARRESTGFVGRDGVIDQILDLPRASFVVISGEPGIGKTRLAEEVMSAARRDGALVAFGRCHDDEGAPPLWPWRQILRDLDLDATNPVDASELADLFAQFEHMRRSLVELSREHPLVIVLDDVQWADLTSLRLLAFLATELRAGDILILVTIRDTDVAPESAVADTLVRLARASAVRWELTGLQQPAVRELLSLVSGLEVTDETAAELTDRTGGNPFYVSEIARFWTSYGVTDQLPTAVGDVVRARVASLSERAQTALTMAAVLGREFDVELLANAIGTDGETVNDSLADALTARLVVAQPRGRMRFAHALVADALLAEAGPGRVGRLHLHAAATMRQARLGDGGPAVSAAELARQLDHAAQLLGDAYAAAAGQAAVEAAIEAGENGGFIDEARWWERSIAHGRRASIATEDEVHLLTELAIARLYAGLRVGPGSSAEARREAIDLARTLPNPERGRALAEAGTVAFYRVHTWQWRPPGTRDAPVVAALETALAELPENDPERRVRVLASLAVELLSTPEGAPRSAGLADAAVELARSTNDVDLLGQALLVQLLVLDVPGGRQRQKAAIAEVLALRDRGLGKIETAVAMTWSVGCRIALADGPVETAPNLEEARSLAAELHDPVMQLTGSWAGVGFAFFRGDLDLARRRALTAYRRHVELGRWGSALLLVAHEAFRLRELGEIPERPELIVPPGVAAEEIRRLDGHAVLWAAWRGDAEEAEALVEHHMPRVLEWRGSAWMMWMTYLVEAALVGAPGRVERLYDELAPYAGEIILRGPYPPHGAVDHYLGLAAAGLGRNDVAARHFADAAVLHDAVRALPWRPAAADERAAIIPELDRFGFVDLLRRATTRSSA